MAQIKFADLKGQAYSCRVESLRIETVKDIITKKISYLANNSGFEISISKEVYEALKAEGCKEI